LFRGIQTHLERDGSCILNVFRPFRPREVLIHEWPSTEEQLESEIPFREGTLQSYCRNTRICQEPLVLYPDLIYRYLKNGQVQDEAVLSIAMRCYYPDQFENLITDHGFRIRRKWGGYNGESYGEGPELVVQFGL